MLLHLPQIGTARLFQTLMLQGIPAFGDSGKIRLWIVFFGSSLFFSAPSDFFPDTLDFFPDTFDFFPNTIDYFPNRYDFFRFFNENFHSGPCFLSAVDFLWITGLSMVLSIPAFVDNYLGIM